MKKILSLLIFPFIFGSCHKDMDDEPNQPLNVEKLTQKEVLDLEIKDFVWKGLNTYYLWQADIPNLADNQFASSIERTILSNEKYFNFLNSYPNPYKLFDALKYQKDRFSWIVNDYEELERTFQGINQSTGMDFRLSLFSEESDNILGFVRYVLPGTNADKAGVKRGVIFTKVDGIQLTKNNYQELLFSQNTTYTINSVHLENNTLVPNQNATYTLTKQEVRENPVFIHKIIEKEGKKIGYIMYNSFTDEYDLELNDAFSEFKSAGVDELILDLRYNGGGAVSSAIYLSSMITGQFNEKLFLTYRFNKKIQAAYKERNWSTKGYFTNYITTNHNTLPINSLEMKKIYVIATSETASASELVINGLRPYIDVTHIGTTTVGKNQASRTIKDWIGENKVNPKHKWAMQPIISKIENAKGFGDYEDGLKPDIEIREDLTDMGTLGELDEPLLAKTLSIITGGTERISPRKVALPDNSFVGNKSFQPLYQEMYLSEDLHQKK